ncbi:MAG: SpoIIIAH-like family protein [Selenomonadales bacterium]|nr:SpoIIIAH-like family protein [Selenomonadales bacterium]
MICQVKWKRWLGIGMICLVGAVALGICAEWQTAAREAAVPVAAKVEREVQTDEYIDLRIARDRNRSEARELLVQAAETEKDGTLRQEKQRALWQADKNRQTEAELETIIKARGQGDALVFCQDDSVTVMVRTNALQREEVTELADLAARISGVKKEHILIRAKP